MSWKPIIVGVDASPEAAGAAAFAVDAAHVAPGGPARSAAPSPAAERRGKV